MWDRRAQAEGWRLSCTCGRRPISRLCRSPSCSCCRGCSRNRLPVGLSFLHLKRKGHVTQWGDVTFYNVPSLAEIAGLPWPKHGRAVEAVAFGCGPPNAELLPLFNSLNDLDHVNLLANVGPTDTGDPGIGLARMAGMGQRAKEQLVPRVTELSI